jgi:hypothetical protein
LLQQLTAAQLAEWEAFDSLEPIGKWRDDYRTALLCTLISNMFSDKKSNPAKLTDFLLQWDKPKKNKKHQTVEEMKKILELAFGKKKK